MFSRLVWTRWLSVGNGSGRLALKTHGAVSGGRTMIHHRYRARAARGGRSASRRVGQPAPRPLCQPKGRPANPQPTPAVGRPAARHKKTAEKLPPYQDNNPPDWETLEQIATKKSVETVSGGCAEGWIKFVGRGRSLRGTTGCSWRSVLTWCPIRCKLSRVKRCAILSRFATSFPSLRDAHILEVPFVAIRYGLRLPTTNNFTRL